VRAGGLTGPRRLTALPKRMPAENDTYMRTADRRTWWHLPRTIWSSLTRMTRSAGTYNRAAPPCLG